MANTLLGKKADLSGSQTADSLFDIQYLKSDLKERCVRGGVVTIVAQCIRFFLRLVSTAFLARLLTPQEFGLIAMVTVITGFVAMFKDMGLSMATVQKAEINHAQISTLFWINVALSVAIMVVIAALAPVIAWFYGEPRLIGITLALAFAFIFSGFTIQHQALLRRQMRFRLLAIIQIASMIISLIAAIIAAWLGAGYWALVIMHLTSPIITMIGVWLTYGWRPGLPVRRCGIRSMISFGGNLTVCSVINYFARNLDNILIGWYWGAGLLGLYSKAYSLLMLPLSQINAPIAAVAIPALSRLQDEPKRYRNYYIKTISMIAFVSMPGVMFLIVMSTEIIHIICGPQWNEAARIFALLGLAALIQPIANANGWLFVSQGRTSDLLKWSFVGSTIAIASIIVGLPLGISGVAACYALSGLLIRSPLSFWYVCRKGPVRSRDIYRVMALPTLTSILVLFVLLLARKYLSSFGSLIHLGLAFGLSSIIVLLLYILFPAGRQILAELKEVIVILLKRKINYPAPESSFPTVKNTSTS